MKIGYDSHCPGHESNLAPPEYKSEALLVQKFAWFVRSELVYGEEPNQGNGVRYYYYYYYYYYLE
jgi:hypothetical protein